MRRHGSIWRHYRNERDFGEQSRRTAAWHTLRFRIKLITSDVRRWWWRLFAPLDVQGIYLNWRPHGSALILDNLGIWLNWEGIEQAARERAARERGATICKVVSFPVPD